MSWSVGFNGPIKEAKRELRKQVCDSDTYAGRLPEEGGMSHEENQLRRAAQTLLLAAVEAQHRHPSEGYLAVFTHVKAEAHGSEYSDNAGGRMQSLHLSVEYDPAPQKEG